MQFFKNKSPFRRVIAMALVLVMAMGLISDLVPAMWTLAADSPPDGVASSVTRGADPTNQVSGRYKSTRLTKSKDGRVGPHMFGVNADGKALIAYCIDYGKDIAAKGGTWNYVGPAEDEVPLPALQWLGYYNYMVSRHDEVHQQIGQPCSSQVDADIYAHKYGVFDSFASAADIAFLNSVAQVIIWLTCDGIISDPVNSETDRAIVAEEMADMVWTVSSLGGWRLKDKTENMNFYKNMLAGYAQHINNGVTDNSYKYYLYKYSGSNPDSIQRLIVGYPSSPSNNPDQVYVKAKKVYADTGAPLPGAEFVAYLSSSTSMKVGTAVSGADGWAVIGPIGVDRTESGENIQIFIEEVGAPTDPQGREFAIIAGRKPVMANVDTNNTADTAAECTFIWEDTSPDDEPDPGDPPEMYVYKTSTDGTPLADATFDVYLNGQRFTEIRTGSDGYARVEPPEGGFKMGYYEFVETKAPAGYLLPRVRIHGVFYDPEDPATSKIGIEIKNDKWPEIVIVKKDAQSGAVLENAIFKISIDGRDFGSLATGGDGRIVIDYATYSAFWDATESIHTVHVEEITAPGGYLLDEDHIQDITLIEGQTRGELVFTDHAYPKIKVTKLDRDTNQPLAGAKFTVSIDGNPVGGDHVTGDDGTFTLSYEDYKQFLGDAAGTDFTGWGVEVTETDVPYGYNLDDQPEAVGANGATIVKHLEFGQSLIEFVFQDTPWRPVFVQKRDSQTNWPLADATFQLECIRLDNPKDNGKFNIEPQTTDGTGIVKFGPLPNGQYRVRETKEPGGYANGGTWGEDHTDEWYYFDITSDTNKEGITLTKYNAPLTGLKIIKRDTMTNQPIEGVRFKITPLAPLTAQPWEAVTDKNGLIVKGDLPAGSYQIEELASVNGYVKGTEVKTVQVNDQHDAFTVTFDNQPTRQVFIRKLQDKTDEPLPGARFEITKADGSHVRFVETGANGWANVTGLAPGAYVVKEIEAPDGHILDPMPQTFVIPDDPTQDYIITRIFKNTPYGDLFIFKYDEFSKVPIKNAVFEIKLSDGTYIQREAKTDDQGVIHIDNLETGTYEITEVRAADGYLLNEKTYSRFIKAGTTETVEIPNRKAGGVMVYKIDAKTESPLKGASFELRTMDGRLIGTRTTEADGYARWGDVEPGWYQLIETKAPEGYAISPDSPWNVEVKEFAATELTVTNDQDATITVTKRDSETDVPLRGATFEVRDMYDKVVATITTDNNGVASTERLQPGSYKIVETKAPDGYVLSDKVETVNVEPNTPVSIDYYDTPMQSIVVKKVDAISNEPLAGAVIEIRTVSGTLVDTYTTDASGIITTRALNPGYYNLVETRAPEGYVLDGDPILVQVTEGKPTMETIKNYPETIIRIYKTDAATGAPLQYAEFEVTDLDGRIVQQVTTDEAGWAYTLKLQPGEYLVRETKAPSGYSVDPTQHRVTIERGKNSTLRLTNAPGTVLHIEKLDKVTRKNLAGAEFELRYDTGHGDCTYIGTYTTDAQGFIHTEPLTPGFYLIKEVNAPEGYDIIKDEIRYCVKAGEYNHVVVEDIPLGSLIVRKIDSRTNRPIAGATFKLENADTSDLVGLKDTDAQGEAVWTGLKEGFYIITESVAPDNYNKQPCSKTIKVEYGKVTYVDFKDDENGSLKIVLQDKYDDSYLMGGHFIVTRESDQIIIFDGSTDVTGTIVVGSLTPGWYTVEQTFPPDKYIMIDVTTKVEIKAGQQQTVYFKDATAGLVIEKVDKQYPELMLEGARFQVKRDTDGIVIGEYVTGKDGLALIDALTPGLYTVSELVAPRNYALDADPQLVHVREGTTAHVTFLDTALSSITVKLVDAKTKLPIAGVVVEVWQQNGVLVNTYTSDITGVVQTDKLPAGQYVLKVVSVPDGYSIAGGAMETTVTLVNGVETTFEFNISSSGNLKVMSTDNAGKALSGMQFKVVELDGKVVGTYTTGSDGSAIVADLAAGWYLVVETKAPDGFVLSDTPEQRIEVKSGATASLTFKHGQVYGLQILTSCIQTGAKIEGAKYEIRTLDQKLVGTYTSDEAGLIFVTLTPGWYTVKPVSVPNGYTITDETARNVEIKADGITCIEFFVNQMSSIRVRVVDGTTGAPLHNVRLQLKNGEKSIQEYYTNNEGYITLEASVLVGEYTLEMISCPSGYILDTVPKSIKALTAETTEIVWKLYKEGGQIQVVVTSADYNKTLDKAAGQPLQGAVFEVENADTYQVVAQMISDVRGIAASPALPIGRYIVKMVSAPAYYGVNSTWSPEVRIKINNDVVRVETTVSSVSIDSNVTLKSNTTIKAGSTMRVDVIAARNGSDVRLDNFFMHIKVPTDAARITTLSTGTWNHAVFYSISYKTNMNDYRVLAQNLQSTNVYQYGISTQALGLMSGEYVTDIRYEFGTVPAGFAIVQKPCYTQYVLATVYNGYKLISRVELGGQFNTVNVGTAHIDNNNPYSATGAVVIVDGDNAGSYGGIGAPAISGNSGQWTTSSGLWTTTVSSNIKPPSQLPTTGY